jgi:uncharacterized lipoprotein YbaY
LGRFREVQFPDSTGSPFSFVLQLELRVIVGRLRIIVKRRIAREG